jgi:hypothetical protein
MESNKKYKFKKDKEGNLKAVEVKPKITPQKIFEGYNKTTKTPKKKNNKKNNKK